MRRREFITLLGGTAAAWPIAAGAQDGKIARLGFINPGLALPITAGGYPLFLDELRKLGFAEGRNLIIDIREIGDNVPKAYSSANELVAAKADVILVTGSELGLQAAAAARPATPIVVFANNFDIFERGYISSLSRPGGNITGLYYRQPELAAKQLELLVEAFPDRKKVGALYDHYSADQFTAAQRSAQSLGLTLYPIKFENPPYDFAAALATLAQDQVQMLHILSTPNFTRQAKLLAGLAIEYRLPTMNIFRHYTIVGGLLSYGVDTRPMWRRAASYVAKILRGARAADLPVEQASNFELVVNLKTAKALGVTMPTSILLRADEVIE